MPELPEVETVCRGLHTHTLGATITSVLIREPRLRVPVPASLQEVLQERTIQRVYRKAKFIIMECDRQWSCLIHLGMSGRVLLTDAETPFAKHDHIIFTLHDGRHIVYHDPRRFGLMSYAATSKVDEHFFFKQLGVEPLTSAFNAEYLWQHCMKTGRIIKAVLMDNAVVVGIGNIYANEALFMAGVRPERIASSLTPAECERIVAASKVILAHAIACGGTSMRDYVHVDGTVGFFFNELKVYGREKQACVQCGATIQRIAHHGRSSFFCTSCQN